VGELLRDDAALADELRRWATSEDMWKRRTAIIAQVLRKRETDLTLLYDCIEPNRQDREFFIRKGIGWALREYAKTNPEWVRAFVAGHDLSLVSRREATKHLAENGEPNDGA
jgi:3-methyladenine DNA glycosylase AlkD